jgi:(p)ppGpp synthase/HD superfamily hydrolase
MPTRSTSLVFQVEGDEDAMREYDRVLRDHLALVNRAADFAARRHVNQRREGASQEPYINHLAEVANLLATTAAEPDAHLVAAGWLHDTLEDTHTTKEELEKEFGRFVTDIVLEVTDDKSLPKGTRKRLQVATTAGKSREARLLEIADKTSNVSALAVSPPPDWGPGRMADYVRWAEDVVVSCRGLNAEPEKAFDMAAAAARAAILATDPDLDRLFSNSH